MPAVRSLVVQVERLFSEIEECVGEYAERVGLQCPAGCGACCDTPDIEVTYLDALPVAMAVAEAGRAEEVLAKLEAERHGRCPLFENHGGGKGRCSGYAARPTLCRLFGFAAVPNKRGEALVALCKVQKERDVEVDAAVEPPLFPHFARRLQAIHPEYGTERVPIGEAIRWALGKVAYVLELEKLSEPGTGETRP